MKSKTLVISGINIVDGGALSVYYDCLNSIISKKINEKYNVIALVSKKALFEQFGESIKFIEFPKSKKSWLRRIYYEYVYFKKFSKKLSVDIWLSLHDITPNVKAKYRYVYCHNPSPFNKMSLREAKYGFKYYLFSKFYKYLYAKNIKKNTNIIVQQNWIKKEFEKMFHVDNVIVARPSLPETLEFDSNYNSEDNIFIFPSFPRYYKNFEIACEAAQILVKNNITDFKLQITISGTENKYANDVVKKYSSCPNIEFIGLLSRKDLYEVYNRSLCLIFMSKLETWGMPIMEFKQTKRPIIVADLPYGYETVGDYNPVAFVDCFDKQKLANKMQEVIETKNLTREQHNIIDESNIISDWDKLFDFILNNK